MGADLAPAFRAASPALGAPMPDPRGQRPQGPHIQVDTVAAAYSTAPARDLRA